ncbi:MAG: SpoIIE family protein phosphatase [Bernardetiaceae bacterium]|nr:SpoIIE family protein phosphatase [Bernardetiaceae bacterium]
MRYFSNIVNSGVKYKYLSICALHKLLWICVLLYFILSSLVGYAQKSDFKPFAPDQRLSQFLLEVWDSDKGLPTSALMGMAQTKDSYLWIGSYDGLLRFDGISFELYNKNNTKAFLTNNVVRLLSAPDGKLWIATQGSGLLSFEQEQFVSHGLQDAYIESMWQGSADSLWIGTRSNGLYLYEVSKKRFTAIQSEVIGKTSIYDITYYNGAIWLASQHKGVFILKNDKLFPVNFSDSHKDSETPICFYVDNDNNLWHGTLRGIYKYNTQNEQFELAVPELKNERIHDLKHDAAGNLWIVSRANIYRQNVKTAEVETLLTEIGDPIDDVRNIVFDKSGELWIPAARHGLCHLREGKFRNYTDKEGLSHKATYSVCETPDGGILVGMANGYIHRLDAKRNQITDFEIKTDIRPNEIFNLNYDSKGNLWVSTYRGLLLRKPSGEERLFKSEDGLKRDLIRLTYEDSQQRLWVGTRGGGLMLYDEASTSGNYFISYDSLLGFNADFVMSIDEDKEGALLIGTNSNGLFRIDKQNKVQQFTTEDGMISNLIFNTYTDAEGIIWLATNAGLMRWDGKIFQYFKELDSYLPQESIFDVLEDSKGYLWLPCNRGVIRVEKKAITQNNTNSSNLWKLYDKSDGMKSEQTRAATQSLRSQNGMIWIPTNGGLLRINPERIPKNEIPPAVYIKKIIADNEPLTFEAEQDLILSIQPQRMAISFTALSYRAPKKVKFKYRLQGFDKNWIESDASNREAIYTNLEPGSYIFEIQAVNNDGVWSETITSQRIIIKPYFYQTIWFYMFVALALVMLVFVIIKWRTQKAKQRAIALEKIVKQRTDELHLNNQELLAQQQVLDERNSLIEEQNRNTISSINYARRIQEAILPTADFIQSLLPEAFILFRPRDIVSGDFYWVTELEGKVLVATVDCTGHGVPGAFMSLIANDTLNKVVIDSKNIEAHEILNKVHQEVYSVLKQSATDNQDGMDMSVWVWDKNQKILDFAGAKHNLVYVQHNKLHEIRGNKESIGGNYELQNQQSGQRNYTKHSLKIDTPTMIYTFSDGYQDQFGGKKDRKFMKKRLKNLLFDIHEKPVEEQKSILNDTLDTWMQGYAQVDDILLIGVRL